MLAIAARPESSEPFFVDVAEPPAPGPGQVVCETVEIGVCGTDREILHSRTPAVPEGEQHLILGHECLARVVAIGPGVSELAVGQWVTPLVRRPRGAGHPRLDMQPFCDIRERGIYHQHGFATRLWLDEPAYLVPVADSIRSVAVLAEPVSIAEKGINEAVALQRGRLGEDVWRSLAPRVLVTGQGPIAMAGVIAAVARDWPTTVLGRDPAGTFRSRLVEELGARYVSTAEFDQLLPPGERDGFDLVLECTGSEEMTLEAARLMATSAVMAWLGSSRLPEPLPLNVGRLMRDAILKNHVFVACVNSAPRDFHDALAHLATMLRRFPEALPKLFTNRCPFHDALPHYLARQPQGIKTVLDLRLR